jgi:urease accessory protein
LLSPTLPIGATPIRRDWVEGQLRAVLGMLDVPVPARLYRAWAEDDTRRLEYWSRLLLAARESRALLVEDRNLGAALANLLLGLGVDEARAWCGASHTSFAAMLALGAWR